MKELLKLKNIGEVSAKMLNEIDVFTRDDIIKLGPSTIYHILKAQGFNVNLMMVYALEGAITNRHFNEIPRADKERLRKEVENTLFDNLTGN